MIKIRIKAANGTVLQEKLVEQFPASLGRNPACGIPVSDADVSSQHAELNWDGATLQLRDLGSRNGTFVDEERISTMQLKLPCVFRLGASLIVEVAAAGGAPAVSPATSVRRLPRPERNLPPVAFRPARPPTPVAAPIAAMARINAEASALEAEVIAGPEFYWHWLMKAPPRAVALTLLGLSGVLFLCHLLIFRESAADSLLTAGVALFGSLLLGALLGALFALPGLLFREEYEFKPLFIQLTFSIMLMTLEILLKPAMLYDYFGFVARVLCLPLLVGVCAAGPYVFFFSTFPHKHARRLVMISAVFTVLGVLSQSYVLFSTSRRSLLHDAFVGEFHASRGLAGASTGVKTVTDDLRDFGAKHPPR